jgi:hypothetical protein
MVGYWAYHLDYLEKSEDEETSSSIIDYFIVKFNDFLSVLHTNQNLKQHIGNFRLILRTRKVPVELKFCFFDN